MTAAALEPIRAVARVRRRDLPELLQQIHDPPRALFLRGAADPDILALPAVAIVGARACSPYGAQVARMLGLELAAGRGSAEAAPADRGARAFAPRGSAPPLPHSRRRRQLGRCSERKRLGEMLRPDLFGAG